MQLQTNEWARSFNPLRSKTFVKKNIIYSLGGFFSYCCPLNVNIWTYISIVQTLWHFHFFSRSKPSIEFVAWLPNHSSLFGRSNPDNQITLSSIVGHPYGYYLCLDKINPCTCIGSSQWVKIPKKNSIFRRTKTHFLTFSKVQKPLQKLIFLHF